MSLTSGEIATFLARVLSLNPNQPLASHKMSPDTITALIVLGLFLVTLLLLSPAVCVLVFYGKVTPWVILLVVGADILITVASLGLVTPGTKFPTSF